MKLRNCLILSLVLLVVGGAASAQGFSVDIFVDENGHGRLTNTAGFNSALAFAMLADPGPGGLASAATYDILNPPGLVSGDLFLREGDVISDVIRFNANQRLANGDLGTLVFYSDQDGGVDALADTGLPTAFYTNVFNLPEVNLGGGLIGAIYTPTAGQPGFVAGAAGPVTYHITSDVVPEGSSVAMMCGGLLAPLSVLIRRRKKTAA